MMVNLKVLEEEHQEVKKSKNRNSNQSSHNDIKVVHREVFSRGNRELEKYVNDKCSKALLKNDEYKALSNKSIKVLNSLKSLVGDNIGLLLEYEDIITTMQGIVEVEAYKLDRRIS